MAMTFRLRAVVLATALAALPACTTGRTGPAGARTQTVLLDLNTATRAQLRRLPGITDAYASRIISNRPYKVKHELETRKILPAAVYARIRDRVTAREP
jgi:DNA uptake protein ComE-like DNA-binding protein